MIEQEFSEMANYYSQAPLLPRPWIDVTQDRSLPPPIASSFDFTPQPAPRFTSLDPTYTRQRDYSYMSFTSTNDRSMTRKYTSIQPLSEKEDTHYLIPGLIQNKTDVSFERTLSPWADTRMQGR
jgi:hypothetical protein